MDEPFNPNKFNFNRVGDKETLITVADKDETHRILVNVSPLMYGHGLLIPYSKKCLPQQLTSEPIQLAIRLLRKCMEKILRSVLALTVLVHSQVSITYICIYCIHHSLIMKHEVHH